MLLSAATSQLLVVDMQERLAPAMRWGEDAMRRVGLLLAAASRLGVPVTISEQYPKGLGPTVPAVIDAAGDAPRLAKTAFSCLADEAIAARLVTLRGEGLGQLIVTGFEAHVCVLQTALDARRVGFEVFVVADAVSSRRADDLATGLARLAGAGVTIVTSEMVVFEWLGRAGTEDFKALSALLR